MRRKPKTTSWGRVADWYDVYLEGEGGSYQRQVILPNLLRVLNISRGEKVFDLACGQGFFAREFAKLGAKVSGTDISPELIEIARKRSPADIAFYVAPAHKLSFARNGEFDAVIAVFALQNMENLSEVFMEVRRVLVVGGRFIMVLNHPAFRIPKRSSWGWDEKNRTQYRRVDRYLSSEKSAIAMHPGEENGAQTFSYHRSLQDFFKALAKNGFAVSRLEEWISHKKSERGPRQVAEDTARKEIPLFLMLEAKILPLKK
ncbi:MAG: methyltransferase domain-containing protein [Candidatus Niyogibacteria bacterium]|nr:methyltransferase domain-containing protein [Candidatus Niyogibacteria bacterium]